MGQASSRSQVPRYQLIFHNYSRRIGDSVARYSACSWSDFHAFALCPHSRFCSCVLRPRRLRAHDQVLWVLLHSLVRYHLPLIGYVFLVLYGNTLGSSTRLWSSSLGLASFLRSDTHLPLTSYVFLVLYGNTSSSSQFFFAARTSQFLALVEPSRLLFLWGGRSFSGLFRTWSIPYVTKRTARARLLAVRWQQGASGLTA